MQAFISQQDDSFDESDPDPGEDTLLDTDEDDSSHTQSFNLLSILLNLRTLPRYPKPTLGRVF